MIINRLKNINKESKFTVSLHDTNSKMENKIKYIRKYCRTSLRIGKAI